MKVLALEKEKQLKQLSDDILELISECNEIYYSKKQEALFKTTSEFLKNIPQLSRPIENRIDMGIFIDAIYKMLYEGSGSLKRIEEFGGKGEEHILLDVKHIRTDFRHDIEHGKPKELKRKKVLISKIYKNYAGESTLAKFQKADYANIQIALLKAVRLFLMNLKKKM